MNTYEINFSVNGFAFAMIIKCYPGNEYEIAEELAKKFNFTFDFLKTLA